MSESDLFSFQVGKESVWGSAVDQTAKLMEVDSLEIEPIVESEAHAEIRGTLDPSYNATLNRIAGAASLSGIATYEDLPYWLDSLLGEATPTGTGPYTYTYAGPGAKPTPRQMTVARGYGTVVKSLVSALANTLTLEWATNAPVMLGVGMFGHSVADDSLDSLSDRAVNPVHSNDATLYIDSWGGTVGSTAYTGVAFNIGLSLDANRTDKPGIGSVTPLSWKQMRGDPGANQLVLRLEFDAAAETLLDALLTSTDLPFRRLVRITTALDANHSLQVDFAGFSPEAPVLNPDEDGIAVVEFTLNAMNDPNGMGGWLDVENVSQVSALP